MDALYFSHDYNASKDPKLLRVRKQLGHAGIGLYWELIEMLYKNDNAISLTDIDALAIELDADEDVLNRLISDFGLFEQTDTYLFSPSINKRIDKRKELGKIRNKWREDKQQISEDKQTLSEDKQTLSEDKQQISEDKQTLSEDKQQISEDKQTLSEDKQQISEDKQTLSEDKQQISEDKQTLSEDKQTLSKDKQAISSLKIKEKNNYYIPPTPLREGGKKQKFDFSLSNKPAWLDANMAEVFKTWIDYKRSRGQAYANEDTARTCYEQLIEFSGRNVEKARQIVRTSIANNWHGLFALDKNQPLIHKNPMVIDTSKSNFQKF